MIYDWEPATRLVAAVLGALTTLLLFLPGKQPVPETFVDRPTYLWGEQTDHDREPTSLIAAELLAERQGDVV